MAWLERHLREYEGTVVLVTHDRYFLDNVTGWILELDQGHGIPWEGNYSSWLEQKQDKLHGAGEEGQQAPEDPRARAGVGQRLAEGPAEEEQGARRPSTRSWSARSARCSRAPPRSASRPGERLGNVVVKAEKVRKAYGDKLLFDDLNFHLPRGGIVGVVGPNGAGKTTLMSMITGEETARQRRR